MTAENGASTLAAGARVRPAGRPAPDYRALFDSVPGPYLVLAPDLSIVAVSDAYLRATMLERETILGRPLFEVFPDNPDDPEADGVRNLRVSLERVREERRMDAMAEHTYSIRRPGPQGGGFEARRWRPVNSPVLDADGKLTWIIHQLEDALRDSESRYRFLFENMLSGYALCRMRYEDGSPRDFMFQHVNARFAELTGLESVEGKLAGEVVPGIRESSPEMFASFARVAGTGASERIEIYVENLKNWFDIAVYSPARGQFIAVFDNITKRKLAEAVRAQLAAIVDSSEDAIIGKSLDGIITSWNRGAEMLFGYTADEAQGQPMRLLIPPDRVAEEETIHARISLGGSVENYETVRTRKDGKPVDIAVSISPTRNGRGEVVGVSKIARDITGRKRAEGKTAQMQAAVARSAREWRVTFDALDSPVMLAGLDGRIVRLNRAMSELTGRNYADNVGHLPPGENGLFPWAGVTELIRCAADGSCRIAAQLADRDGLRVWDCVARYFEAPDSGAGLVVFSAREITNLIRLQESLRHGEVMSTLGSLVAGVAHEVRNPLFGILATLDAFEANHGARQEFREYLAILRGEAERLSALMKDLLDYGRPPELNPDRGSIEALLQDALKPVLQLAQPAGVRLVLDCAPGLPEVSFDRSRLPQVFINLLDNAVRHSPPGGTVRLSAALSADPGWLECSVADEGPGVKPEDLSRLFQPFFTRRAGGTGLGLAIVQRIVEQHGGQVAAANPPEGGAVFTVRLPIGVAPG